MLSLLVAITMSAHAQTTTTTGTGDTSAATGGFDAHGFKLAAFDADIRDPLSLQRPGVFSQGDWFVSGLAEYAKSPLVQVLQPSSGAPATEVPLVDNLLVMNVSAGVAAHDRLRFDLLAPVHGLSTGPDASTEGPAMGDLRLSAMGVLLRPKHQQGGGGGGIGVTGFLDLPTGTRSRFLGDGVVSGGGVLSGTGEAQRVTFTGQVGAEFRQKLEGLDNVEGADRLVTGAALGFVATDTVGITFEAISRPSLEQATFTATTTSPPTEGIASLRYHAPTGGHFTFGGAMGITDGPGVPAFRVFVGGGFGKQEPPLPPDFDPVGELSATDLCPTEPETVNGWKDDDGCPDTLAALLIDVRYQGQSREADAEVTGPKGTQMQRVPASGLSVDAVPGSSWSVRATSGCLAGTADAVAAESGAQLVVELQPIYDAQVEVVVTDTEGVVLPEAQVLWTSQAAECVPAEPMVVDAAGAAVQRVANGTHVLKVTATGYKLHEEEVTLRPAEVKRIEVQLGAARIQVEKKQIKILEKVQFETAKAVIKPESFALLNEVAAVIITNPDLGRVEVSGHTDNRGSDTYNQTLSEQRAASVREYLIGQGVAAERLLAVGYGETKPIDTNRTPEGREVNRRVEFNLIDVADDDGGGDDGAGGAQ